MRSTAPVACYVSRNSGCCGRARLSAAFGLPVLVRKQDLMEGNAKLQGSGAHFGPATVGLLMAVSGFGSVIGALTARRLAQALGSARACLFNVAVGGLAGLLIPLAAAGPRVVFYLAGTGIVSATIVGNNIIMASFRQAYCPPAMLGRVVASQRFVAYGSAPLGALLAGALATGLAIRPALWILLTMFALSGSLLLTAAMVAYRDLPAGQAEPVIEAASGSG